MNGNDWTEIRCACGRWVAEVTGSIRTICPGCGAEIRYVKHQDRALLTTPIFRPTITAR